MASYSSGIQLDVDSISLSPSEIRDAILNDGTEFAGGNIDIPISASKAYAPGNVDISDFSYFESVSTNTSGDYESGSETKRETQLNLTGDGVFFAPNYNYWVHRTRSNGDSIPTRLYYVVDGKEILLNEFTIGGSSNTVYSDLAPFFPARFESSFKVEIEVDPGPNGFYWRACYVDNRGPNEGNNNDDRISWPMVAYK